MTSKRKKQQAKKEEKSIEEKHKKKKEIIQSTQQNVPISDFYNGFIINKDGDFFCVMEILASPYGLKKNDEKNRIFRNYMSFLELSPTNFHIKSITTSANLEDQIQDISKIIDSKEDLDCDDMRREYLAHLRNAENRTVVTRYFLSFAYEGGTRKNAPNYKENACDWLVNKCNSLAEILRSCGDSVVRMNDQEPNKNASEIMYMLYNRKTSKSFSMSKRINELMGKYIQMNPSKYANGEMPYIPPTEYIAPQQIDFTDSNIVKCDGLYYEFLYIPSSNYPKNTFCSWLTYINKRQEVGIDIDVFYTKEDAATLSYKLNTSIARQQVAVAESSDKTSNMTFESRDKLQSAMYLRQGIANGDTVYNLQTIFTVIAPTIQELNEKVERLKNYAVQQGTKLATVIFQPKEVFDSVMMSPTLDKTLKKKTHRNTLTLGAASTYLFTSSQMICKDGVYIADDLSTGSPVIIDFFDTQLANNPHIFVSGETGSGKSVSIKLMAMRARVKGDKVFAIIPEKESEFKRISDEFNGQFISLGPGSSTCMNIFDIYVPDEKAIEVAKQTEGIDLENSSWLIQKLPSIVSFFRLLDSTNKSDIFSSLENQEILNDALMKTYAKFGITEDNNSIFVDKKTRKLKDFPIISDLIKTLKESDREQCWRMATVLNIFTHGTYSFFNGKTNVDVNNSFVVIGLEKNDQTFGLATYAAIEYIWGNVKSSKLERKYLLMDEWWKMAYDSIAVEKTMEIARLARSYNCSLIIATQRMADVMALENGKYGEAVLNSCATKIILKCQSKEIDNMQKVLQLTETEKETIANFEAGQGLLINSIARMRIVFRASEKEKLLTYTDKKTMAKLKMISDKKKAGQRKIAEQKKKAQVVQIVQPKHKETKVVVPTVISNVKVEKKTITKVDVIKPTIQKKTEVKVVKVNSLQQPSQQKKLSKNDVLNKAKENQGKKINSSHVPNNIVFTDKVSTHQSNFQKREIKDSFKNAQSANRQDGRGR